MMRTISFSPHSFFSSCAVNFLVFLKYLPYLGCFTLRTTATTTVLSILELLTVPTISLRAFLTASIINFLFVQLPPETLFCEGLTPSLISRSHDESHEAYVADQSEKQRFETA